MSSSTSSSPSPEPCQQSAAPMSTLRPDDGWKLQTPAAAAPTTTTDRSALATPHHRSQPPTPKDGHATSAIAGAFHMNSSKMPA
eukprot:scaffold15656_cov69-Phaeocystis_antarctica.AAC.2